MLVNTFNAACLLTFWLRLSVSTIMLLRAMVCCGLRMRAAHVFSIVWSVCVSRHKHRSSYDWPLTWDKPGRAASYGRARFHSNRGWEAARSLDESLFGVFRLHLLLHRYRGDCWILHLLLRAEIEQPQTAEPHTGTAQKTLIWWALHNNPVIILW